VGENILNRNSHRGCEANPRVKRWIEPEELVAARISGSCFDGPNDRENIVAGYEPLRKLYDCNKNTCQTPHLN
jgi:hypothetical protein